MIDSDEEGKNSDDEIDDSNDNEYDDQVSLFYVFIFFSRLSYKLQCLKSRVH